MVVETGLFTPLTFVSKFELLVLAVVFWVGWSELADGLR